jgi:hypothetical protein
MPIEEFFLRYWPLILGALGVVVWAMRLEGRVSKAVDNIAALWRQRAEDQSTAATSRKEVHDALSDLQTDVKDILKALGARR